MAFAAILAATSAAALAVPKSSRQPMMTPGGALTASGMQNHVGCSSVYGCIITLACSTRLSFAGVTDAIFDVQVLGDGSDGQPPRIGVVPKAMIEQYDNSFVLPPAARLDIVTKGTSYAVMLDTVPFGPLTTLTLPCPGQAGQVAQAPPPSPTPMPEGPTSLDPTKLDYGWTFKGDPVVRCVSLFSYQAQVWCKLPRDVGGAMPSAAAIENGNKRPLDAHAYERDWIVIEGQAADIRLTWGALNRSGDILRSHE
jgi:hypothetical protein